MKIIKASGEQETYARKKLCFSIKATGAPKGLVDRICKTVEKDIAPGMTTYEISERITKELTKESPVLAAKYSLKKGIMELGPAGYLFEQYVAAILKEYGYKTKTNQIMKGACVSHEIDILVKTKNTNYLLEAKYHNSRGVKTDIKDVMYSFARLLDIKKGKATPYYAWLVTNTKFTTKAITYSRCMGVRLTGWRYPKKEGLEKLIEGKGLYPVTVLSSINKYAKEQLARKNIYFAKDLLHFTPKTLTKYLKIYPKTAERIIADATALCKIK